MADTRMSREEREALTGTRTSFASDDHGATLARTSTAERLQRQNSRQRARQMGRMANHPLEAQSTQNLKLNLCLSLVTVRACVLSFHRIQLRASYVGFVLSLGAAMGCDH